MKILYLDCGMGAAGDMLAGALLELVPDADGFLEKVKKAGIPDVEIRREPSVKCGVLGTHMRVFVHGEEENEELYKAAHEHSHSHSHHDLRGITHLIGDHLDLPEQVAEDAKAVYRIIAEAESKVHGAPVDEVHFHEVGAVDSIVDVISIAVCIDNLDVDKVIVPKLYEGHGTVRCQHGILPVPVPAVTNIVTDHKISLEILDVKGELVTPTGAAAVAALRTDETLPKEFKIKKVGMGSGKRDYGLAGFVRAMIIE